MLQIGNQTIYQVDCLDYLAQAELNSVDVVVTSPPYNLGIAYRSYDDTSPRQQYLEWMQQVADGLFKVMRPDASLFLNVAGSNVDPWVPFEVAGVFRSKFQLQNNIVWVKSISIGDDTVGHFKPINSTRYLNHNHECILHFSKSGSVPLDRLAVGVPFKDKSNIGRRGHAQDRRCAGDVWFIPYPTVRAKSQKFDHPAGFPVALVERCLKLHGVSSGSVVFDPFLGAGTTLVAAMRMDCHGIGTEMDAEYARTAAGRLEEMHTLNMARID